MRLPCQQKKLPEKKLEKRKLNRLKSISCGDKRKYRITTRQTKKSSLVCKAAEVKRAALHLSVKCRLRASTQAVRKAVEREQQLMNELRAQHSGDKKLRLGVKRCFTVRLRRDMCKPASSQTTAVTVPENDRKQCGYGRKYESNDCCGSNEWNTTLHDTSDKANEQKPSRQQYRSKLSPSSGYKSAGQLPKKSNNFSDCIMRAVKYKISRKPYVTSSAVMARLKYEKCQDATVEGATEQKTSGAKCKKSLVFNTSGISSSSVQSRNMKRKRPISSAPSMSHVFLLRICICLLEYHHHDFK